MATAPPNYRVSASAISVIRDLARTYSLTPVSEWPIEQLRMHCVLFRIPPGTTREAVLQKLATDQRVLIAQPLNEFESASTPAFDDPYAKLQANVSALDVAEAHLLSRGTGVRVAIIDTGFDTAHPDLAGRTEATRNYIDDDSAAFRADRHGTQVAGLIAAATNNGIGVVGVAPGVKLLAFKACWQPSATAAGRCNSFTLAQALADALTAKAQIINLSLVGPGDPLLTALVAKAAQAGIIIVGAASADARFGFPAKLPHVLPVAEAEDAQSPEKTCCGRRRATSSRSSRMGTTISHPAVRWPRRRSPASSRCCWRATRNSASIACAACWPNRRSGMTPRRVPIFR